LSSSTFAQGFSKSQAERVLARQLDDRRPSSTTTTVVDPPRSDLEARHRYLAAVCPPGRMAARLIANYMCVGVGV